MKYLKKLSIVIPVYNTEMYLKRCLDRVLEQTYKNVEIIIVNDASTDRSDEIIKQYKEKDKRIIYIEHEQNKGLFCSRVDGAKKATGDYIAFLDSDDYVSIDFYRTLMINIQENNSDIAMGKTILEDENGKRKVFNLFDSKHHFTLKDEEIFEKFFKQKGLSYDWQTIWNKIYKKELWDKAVPYYDEIKEHHVMTEDICFSIVLFYFAKKLTFTQNDGIFYCQNKSSSTNDKKGGYKKLKKNIYDVKRTFDFMKTFLVKVNQYDRYKEKYKEWRALYKDIWKRELIHYNLSDKEIEELEIILNELDNENIIIENNGIYNVQTEWNDGLENIKLAICDKNIKCVSFDMFDTLVQRPFIYPTDLFEFLNKYFLEIYDNQIGINFRKIRVNCEEITRKRLSQYQDITIDEIYKTIKNTYFIEDEILEKLKEKEKELEIRFCSKRKTGYELYTLALALGKKVIITSDMYLDKSTLIKILNKNGYDEISKIYLSSEIRLTKSTGDLYKYVLKSENLEPENIIHIGDNYFSDVQSANNYGIKAMYLIRAYNLAMDNMYVNDLLGMFAKNLPCWKDNANALRFLGIRCMIALFVNDYFDNPYVTFNLNTDFNSDPYLIGYFALGMYMFGVTKWLLDDTKKEGYNNLVFMARDGFLPMETYKIMKRLYDNVPNEKYLYTSRKSLIPVIIRSKLDFYKLSETINVMKNTPNEIVTYLKDCINVDKAKLNKLCSEKEIDINKNFESIADFNFFVKILVDNFYDQKLIDDNQGKLKKYFLNIFNGKSAVFDVGYSARPELYLSQLCEMAIDTYFLNINEDIAYMHSNIGNFKIKQFFNGKPALTGFSYESFISALAPSCIGYNLNNDSVKEIFEKYDKVYQEEFFIGIMQDAAKKFVQDMVNIFGKDIDILYFERYYVSLPIMAYINSSKKIDRMIFDCILFEDDIGIKEKQTLNFLMEREMRWKNQAELHELINIQNRINDSHYMNQSNVYVVDLNNKSKFKKMIFYIHFNKPIFKRRMKEIFSKIPFAKIVYKGIKKIKQK
ncbi:MAG: glycosyltransferase [Bacilli bacterium]|nr:glycosyltransferase [Bacilli bacterium]